MMSFSIWENPPGINKPRGKFCLFERSRAGPIHTAAVSARETVLYVVPLQCFCTVTCSHVSALTVMAVGSRTLQDTQAQPHSPAASCQLIARGHVSVQHRAKEAIAGAELTYCSQSSIFLPMITDILHEIMSVMACFCSKHMWKRKDKMCVFIRRILAELDTPVLYFLLKQLHTFTLLGFMLQARADKG